MVLERPTVCAPAAHLEHFPLRLMYLLAKEFGDDATVKKVEQMVIKVSEGKWFGAEGEMFGYFFFLD